MNMEPLIAKFFVNLREPAMSACGLLRGLSLARDSDPTNVTLQEEIRPSNNLSCMS